MVELSDYFTIKMTDKPEQLGAAAAEAAAEAAKQAAELPDKAKKVVKTKTKSVLSRFSMTLEGLGKEAFSGIDSLKKAGFKMLVDVFASIREWAGLKKKEKKGEGETPEEKAAREAQAAERRDRMVDNAKSKVEGVKGADGMIDVMTKNPSFEDALMVGCDYFKICPAMPMAMMWAESRGIASAENPKSNAKGIAQFMPGTWRNFIQKEGKYWSLKPLKRHNTPFDPPKIKENEHRLDGPVGCLAACWLTRENAGQSNANFNPQNPEHTAFAYLYHHNGPKAAKEMWDWKFNGGPAGKVPGKAGEYYRKKYGNDYEAYANDILALADNVQAIAMVLYSKGEKWQKPSEEGTV